MKRSIAAVLVTGIAFALPAALPATAADNLVLRQDFQSGRLASGVLTPCHRHENIIAARKGAGRDGTWAARLEVFPRGKAPEHSKPEPGDRPSPACLDPKDPTAAYEDGETERAEMWEPSKARLPFGTEVWYGFSMRVDGTVPTDDNRRLVIGQWKQTGGKSPFLAQRFVNRNFHVTFQQDAPNGNECRVLLAYQNEPAPQADSVDLTTGEPCQTDVVVQRFAPLPSPFEAWTDLVYHVKGSAGTDGIVEVWANGTMIARAIGRIGYASAGKQYFKFGPYRDEAPYSTAASIDSFTRGIGFEEVATGLNRGVQGEFAQGEARSTLE
ncbi:heparin lyase I family protein [Azospirillum sp. sgz302134]